MKAQMRDLLLMLPGVMGSALKQGSSTLWDSSYRMALKTLMNPHRTLDALRLDPRDQNEEAGGRSVVATHVLPDVSIIPGFVKINGYSTLRAFILQNFDVIHGTVHNPKPSNFLEVPYDWRQDNRVTAQALQSLINQRLPQWREYSGATDAKVILLAHSMGGLVARYYLEVLEGWPECRALITFGTPFRGSVNALNFLSNGYKKLFADLTTIMRSFPSVYQLLPIYKLIEDRGRYFRIADFDGLPGIEQSRSRDALAFHREIESAVNRHGLDDKYRQSFRLLPFVGTRQPTFQSATISDGKVVVSRELPSWIESPLADGDGTVPRISAIPIELSNEYRDTFVPDHHSSIHRNATALDQLLDRMLQMQLHGLSAVRGPNVSSTAANRPAISLDMEDLYLPNELVEVRAAIVNIYGADAVFAELQGFPQAPALRVPLQQTQEDQWAATISGLPPGVYRIMIKAHHRRSGPIGPVEDVFEVSQDGITGP